MAEVDKGASDVAGVVSVVVTDAVVPDSVVEDCVECGGAICVSSDGPGAFAFCIFPFLSNSF